MATALQNFLKAKESYSIKAKPIGYGINQVSFDYPPASCEWSEYRVFSNPSHYPLTQTDYAAGYSVGHSQHVYLQVTGITAATSGGFSVASWTGGGSLYANGASGAVATLSPSRTGGGSITLGTSPSTGSLAGVSITSGSVTTPYSYTFLQTLAATGGTGSGAYLTVSIAAGGAVPVVFPAAGYTGSGYTVGDTLSVVWSNSAPAITVTVTAISPDTIPITATYTNVVQSSTSGSGAGATFDVQRTGTQGNADAVVSLVAVVNAGYGYNVNDTITLPAASIGGGQDLIISVASIATPTIPPPVFYSNVSSTLTTGAGSGARFNITRSGLTGDVTDIAVAFLGSGYTVGSTVTVSGASIGTAVDLVITCGTPVSTVAGGAISAVSFVTFGWYGGTPSTTYSSVSSIAVSGTGTGALFNLTRDSGGLPNAVSVSNGGYGYVVGDIIAIPSYVIGEAYTPKNSLGITSQFHLYDTGTSFSTTMPGKDRTSNYHAGRKIYYTLYAYELSTATWRELARTSCWSVPNTGIYDWLVSSLPSFYFDLATNSDLTDFLSLLAFKLEEIKCSANGVFEGTKALYSPEELVKATLKEFGLVLSNNHDLYSLRLILSNLVKTLMEKGSVSGIVSSTKAVLGAPSADINLYHTKNLIRDRLTSSFESAEWPSYDVYWSPTYATIDTVTSDTGISYVTYPTDTTISPPNYDSSASNDSVNLSQGYAKLTNKSATAKVLRWTLGPRKGYLTSGSVVGTTIPKLYGSQPKVGDYLSSTTSGLPDNSKVLSYDSVTGTSVIANSTTTTIATGTEIILSKNSGLTGSATEYISVLSGAPYSFSMYFTRPTAGVAYDATVGIRWRDKQGLLIGSESTKTVTAASQPAATTWFRVGVSVLAPAGAVYAEPFFELGNTTTGVAQNAIYYADLAQFRGNNSIVAASKSAGTVTLYIEDLTGSTNQPSTANTSITVTGYGANYDGTYTTYTIASVTYLGKTRTRIQYTAAGANTSPSDVTTGRVAYPGDYDDPAAIAMRVYSSGINSVNLSEKTQQLSGWLGSVVPLGGVRADARNISRSTALSVGTVTRLSSSIYTEPSVSYADTTATIELIAPGTARIVSGTPHQFAVGDKVRAKSFAAAAVNSVTESVNITAVVDNYTYEFATGGVVVNTPAAAITAGIVESLNINKPRYFTISGTIAGLNAVNSTVIGDLVSTTGFATNTAVNLTARPVLAFHNNLITIGVPTLGISSTQPTTGAGAIVNIHHGAAGRVSLVVA